VVLSTAKASPAGSLAVELRDALLQIAEIRDRVAAAEKFRGYRAAPLAMAGGLAVVAALLQPLVLADPAADLLGYLALWLTTAFCGATVAASGVWLRHRHGDDPLARQRTWLAVSQFVPCLAAGGLVTLVVARHHPEHARLLPGLWQVFFSLGVFASCRLLPKAIVGVGVFYLAAGGVNLTYANGPLAFHPWAMGLPFAVGHFGTAVILYWNLERDRHDVTDATA
jgi:hypothetical protein